MNSLITSIIETRKTSEDILNKSLANLRGLSEVDIKEKIAIEINKHEEIYPSGWYTPPPLGIAVLASQKPFERLKYDSLRNPTYLPQNNFYFEKETVGMVHISPVDQKTNLFGDMGLTFYQGSDEKIKAHLKNCYSAILKIAEFAQVGTKFSDLCEFAINLYQNKFKITKWVTVSSDPNYTINLGHTVPGSFENNLSFGSTFDEIKETIRTNRVHIIDKEDFSIPKTCAFTVESRLEDLNDPNMPSAYFHFIVCLDEGQKTILNNFSEIFKTLGMDYIL